MSAKRFEVLKAIASYKASRGFAPTVAELTCIVSIRSKSAVRAALNQLIAEGYLERKTNVPRGLRVLRSAPKNHHKTADIADQRKHASKATDAKKAKAAREAKRMRLMRAEKARKKAGEAEWLEAAVALGKQNDRADAFLDRGALFNGRVRGSKLG